LPSRKGSSRVVFVEVLFSCRRTRMGNSRLEAELSPELLEDVSPLEPPDVDPPEVLEDVSLPELLEEVSPPEPPDVDPPEVLEDVSPPELLEDVSPEPLEVEEPSVPPLVPDPDEELDPPPLSVVPEPDDELEVKGRLSHKSVRKFQ